MVGIYWLLNLTLSSIQGVVALVILVTYLRALGAVRSGKARALAFLSLALLLHSVFSLIASALMISNGLGREVALPLIPVNALSLAVAMSLALIVLK